MSFFANQELIWFLILWRMQGALVWRKRKQCGPLTEKTKFEKDRTTSLYREPACNSFDHENNCQTSEEILKRRIDKNIRNFTDQMVYFIEFESATNNHKLKSANKKIEIIKIDLVKKKPYYTAWTRNRSNTDVLVL